MDILQYVPLIYSKLIIFTLAFCRVAALLTAFNLFKKDIITGRVVISLSLILSTYVILLNEIITPKYDFMSLQMLLQAIIQVFIGFVTALVLNIIFEIFIAVGQLIATQVGLSIASLIDPRFGYITSLTHFYVISGTLLFLYLNGHLFAIKFIYDSFHVLPLFTVIDPSDLIVKILAYSGVIFSASITLSLTIVIILLLTNISIAIMSKFAPQFNLFSIGINMQLILGLVCIYFTYNIFIANSKERIEECLHFLQQTMTRLTSHV